MTLLPKLEKITFHAKIGTQRAARGADRRRWPAKSPKSLAPDAAISTTQAEWAGLLCKADLVTGMVGEFPELQGVMGGYYAERNCPAGTARSSALRSARIISRKARTMRCRSGLVAISVALADKLDTLTNFLRSARSRPARAIRMRCAARHWA